MALRLLSILFPVFAIVALGIWAGRRALRQSPPDAPQRGLDMRVSNQLNLDVFVPALVFAALADRSYDLASFWKLAVAALVIVLGSGLLILPFCRSFRLSAKTLAPTQMFNNCGNLGLPVALLAFGQSALAPAVVMFLVSMLLHFSFGAWLLDHQARLRTLWKIPAVTACLAGLTVSLSGMELWPPLLQASKMLGDVSVPLSLFALGVRLADTRITHWPVSLLAGVMRPLSGLLLAIPMIPLLQLGPQDAAQLLIFSALPPAVMNYVFAERYQQQPELVASIVLVGNVLSLLVMPLVLGWVL